ncbi:MAG: tyrosine-type recombinase/integrase [Pseudomonadota bacterium]|nr:tyrosine-type recombinase/integrase [Pseudomonadota bacterium]
MNDLAVKQPKSIAPVLQKKRIRKMDVFGAKSSNTKRSYLSDLSLFAYWMMDREPEIDQDGKTIHLDENEIGNFFRSHDISPEVIIVWLQEHGFTYKMSTIDRKLSALNWLFKVLKLPVASAYPEVKETVSILRNLHGQYQAHAIDKSEILDNGFTPPERKPAKYEAKQANPLLLKDLKTVISFYDSSKHEFGKNRVDRNKALISLAWHSLLRREEIASLRIEKIRFVEDGMFIDIGKTKTGAVSKPIPFSQQESLCPVRLVKQWLQRLGQPKEGWLFVAVSKEDNIKSDRTKRLSGQDVYRTIKQSGTLSGIEIEFTGHSTRRGAATEIYLAKRDPIAVQKAGNWKSDVFKRYIDESATGQIDNAGIKGIT